MFFLVSWRFIKHRLLTYYELNSKEINKERERARRRDAKRKKKKKKQNAEENRPAT